MFGKKVKKIPKWQQTWNTLPRAAGQTSKGVREHPKPTYDPNETNHERHLRNQFRRKQIKAAKANKGEYNFET